MFKAVSAKVDIQKLERDQLNFWREKSVSQRTIEGRENAPRLCILRRSAHSQWQTRQRIMFWRAPSKICSHAIR